MISIDRLVPQDHAGPVQRGLAPAGFPEERNAPYGIAKLAQLMQAQANRDQYGQDVIYLMPTNLYGPGDKFHPAVSHVIPAPMKRFVEGEAGDDHVHVWGTGSATRVPLCRRRRRGGYCSAPSTTTVATP